MPDYLFKACEGLGVALYYVVASAIAFYEIDTQRNGKADVLNKASNLAGVKRNHGNAAAASIFALFLS